MAKPRKPRTTGPATPKSKTAATQVDADAIEDAVLADSVDDAGGPGAAKENETPDASEPLAGDADGPKDSAEPLDLSEPVDVADAAGAPVADAAPEAPAPETATDREDATAAGDATADTGAADAADEMPGHAPAAPPAPEPMAAAAPAPRPAPRQAVFFPLLFGGIIAAVLGAAALRYGVLEGWVEIGGGKTAELQATIASQSDLIATLQTSLDDMQGQIADLRAAEPDLGPVTVKVTAVEDGVAALTERLDATDTRLAGIETQPIPKAELPAEVVAAYETRLAEMLAAIDARFDGMQTAQDAKMADIESSLNAKLAEVEDARAQASDAEAAAAKAARAAEARAALAEIEAALDSGAGFADPLGALAGTADVAAPAPLADVAAAGIPTLASLQAEFPAAARAALAAATKAAASEGSVDRLTAFFRTQMGARSLEPREGDDPDAILSRAEAALASGELDAVLAEIDALPEAGKAELAGWTAQAETRRAALAAAKSLSEQLNSN